ncbi:MAG: SsrA-binding protein SmpB [Bacilli bacterium]|nr:SsrA-binding protein SmpB [Bacilli bacterium]
MCMKIVSNNKKAYHDYFILDTYEAGIELKGTEIKSVRKGSANLKDAFIRIKNDEAFIENMHIAPYEQGNRFNHDPLRTRKLLLHKKEIRKLQKEVKENGLTIIPTKLYFNTSKAKVEIALAKGKKLYDKRQDLKAKDAKRDVERALKNAY